ncbi:MAG: hypothetical protein FJ033_14275 [Chloroflexi bacterium]|nr:hypothetical protein [Chloroflexota bacterium]
MAFEAVITTGNNHAAIWVRDLEGLERFYADVVGLKILSQRRNAAPNPDATFFTGIQLLRAPADRDTTVKGVFDHVGVNVGNMDEIIAHLARHGVSLIGAINQVSPTTRTCFFADPEGNRVELIERK